METQSTTKKMLQMVSLRLQLMKWEAMWPASGWMGIMNQQLSTLTGKLELVPRTGMQLQKRSILRYDDILLELSFLLEASF